MPDADQTQQTAAIEAPVRDDGPLEKEPAQAPSVEEKLAAQNEANLQKAIEGGYKEEPAPSIEKRKAALIKDMEHAVAHNAPITVAMMSELQELL